MKLRNAFLCLGLLACVGCQSWVYRPDIEQGNQWTNEQVERLSLGLSKGEVQAILGEPLIKDPFHPDRWDYVHAYKTVKTPLSCEHLTLYFKEDRLVRVEKASR